MGTDIDAVREYEWETMLGGEIYDVFGTKGLKLGTQANKMLKVLKEKKEIPDTCDTTLAKKKADKLIQRGYFENLSDSSLGVLRAGMRFYVFMLTALLNKSLMLGMYLPTSGRKVHT